MLQLIGAIPFPDWIKPDAFSVGPIAVKWYGISYVVGIFLAYFYAVKTAKNPVVWVPNENAIETMPVPDKKLLEDFMFYCFFGILIGGRLGYMLFYDLQDFLANPALIFRMRDGGMSFHGGFLGVCVANIVLAWRSKMPLMRLSDMAAISAPLGLGLVRLANFVNQELYGRETDVPWGVIFYENGYPLAPRHPSQLYEAFLEGFVIFMILFFAVRKGKILTKPGTATGMLIFLYGSFRIFVEFFREPDNIEQFGPLTRGMTYSLPMVIAGLALIFWARSKPAVLPQAITRDPNPDASDDPDNDTA